MTSAVNTAPLSLDRLLELDRAAVAHTGELLGAVTDDDLARPTPCAGWNLLDLLRHLVTQHRGFAAAARGEITDLAFWTPVDIGTGAGAARAAYAAAAGEATAAFAAGPLPERGFWLPEIRDGRYLPVPVAIGAHLVDYVAHAWDIAVTLDIPHGLAPDLVGAALAVARAIPDGPDFRGPGKAFGPVVPVAPDAPPLDLMLGLLGRSPEPATP